MWKFSYWIISCQRSLISLFALNSDTNICFSQHAYIIASISNRCSSLFSVFPNLFNYVCFVLRTASADTHWRSKTCWFKKFVFNVLLFENEFVKSRSINYQHTILRNSIKLFEMLFEFMKIFNIFDSVHFLISSFDSCWDSDTSCCLNLITCEHPYLHSSLS